MYRSVAFALATCAWGLPAAAVTVTVDFVGAINIAPIGPISGAPIVPGIVIGPPIEPIGPSLGDTVTGTVSFEINETDQVGNLSGRLPIGSANPSLPSARVSTVERRVCAQDDPCVSTGTVPAPLIPVDETQDRGTLTVKYGPNVTFTDPTFHTSVEWIQASILIAALVEEDAPSSSFFDLLQLPGALPVEVHYTRVSRGNLFLPGVDPRDCSVSNCTTVSAIVTSGSIRAGEGPTPIPVPPTVPAFLAALGALAALRRPVGL